MEYKLPLVEYRLLRGSAVAVIHSCRLLWIRPESSRQSSEWVCVCTAHPRCSAVSIQQSMPWLNHRYFSASLDSPATSIRCRWCYVGPSNNRSVPLSPAETRHHAVLFQQRLAAYRFCCWLIHADNNLSSKDLTGLSCRISTSLIQWILPMATYKKAYNNSFEQLQIQILLR